MNADLIFYLVVFAAMSAVIIGAGVLLAKSGDRIADITGLGGLLIGLVLVAAATSLPETFVSRQFFPASSIGVNSLIPGSPGTSFGCIARQPTTI